MSCIYKYKGKTYTEDGIKKLIASEYSIRGNINDKSKDKEIYEEAAKRAIIAIKQGKQVVFDTTNLTKDKRLSFIEAIKKEIPTANIQYKLMELNPELAKQRIKDDIERINNFEPALKENPVNINAKFPKDQVKANYADGIIGYGTHSTGKYVSAFGGTRTSFNKGETIMISVNGNNRTNQAENVEKTKRAIDKAINSGVVAFIADNENVANSLHNSGGEGEIRNYLLAKGLKYKLFKGVGLYVVNRANVPDATIDRHAESYKQMLEDIKDEGITNYDDNQQFQNLTDKEESEYYSEYNKNDENSNNLQSTESILETNPKLKKFIEDITDEDGSISLFKYNKIINDKEKFGNLPVMKTITKLNNILKNAVNRLWDNRINAENNLKIKFVESLEDEDAVAQFLRKENEIHISKNIFLNILDKDFKDYPEFYTGYLLNHELIHYLTPQSLSTKPQFIDRLLLNEKSDMYLKNLYEREFVKNIKNLYNFSISQLEDLSDYGFTNLAEFVTEAMSNPRFQVKLSTIKYKNENKSLWKKFIKILSDYLSSITGNSIEDTVLEAVISEVTNYITENSNIERTYKTKINNSGDTQFYFVFNKNSEIGIEQEEINNYDNSDNENFEFNEDLTGNEYIENIDNKYLIKFEKLLNKGVITQVCN